VILVLAATEGTVDDKWELSMGSVTMAHFFDDDDDVDDFPEKDFTTTSVGLFATDEAETSRADACFPDDDAVESFPEEEPFPFADGFCFTGDDWFDDGWEVF
jgi:hypothetical protein